MKFEHLAVVLTEKKVALLVSAWIEIDEELARMSEVFGRTPRECVD